MRTIAVSIDEPTLATIDEIGGTSRARGARTNRSQIIRRALSEFLAREERRTREDRERAIFAKHRDQIHRQARALVAAQTRK